MLPEHQNCTGCGACATACPQNCIEMAADHEGFRYPVIDQTRCVNCQACERVCPVTKPPRVSETVRAIAAKNGNDAVRRQSSSGGVFTALAESVLRQGGVVCAAAYDEAFSVIHTICRSADDLVNLRGAKYAQSCVEHCFPELRRLLKQDTQVLFVGTPCQTAALRSFLEIEYKNLLMVDMICHGVPSPFIWEKYLCQRQRTDAPGSHLSAVNLRSKTTGWSRYSYCVEMQYTDGTVYQVPQGQDPFMQGFVSNLYLRPSCFNCKFKGQHRCSDLTLGDFWGVWDLAPEMDDDQGTSLLLIHSRKGAAAWEEVQRFFDWMEVAVEKALEQNPSAMRSSEPHPNRTDFFKDVESGFTVASIRKYTESPKEKAPLWKRVLRKLQLH